jgi:recombination protein RecT
MARNELTNAVATRAEAGIQPGQDVIGTVGKMLADNWALIKSTVPSHVTPERMTRIALNTIRVNRDLLKCSVPSLVGAIMQCARFGFEPNTNGECYIIPYGNEAQFQLGYIGHVQLLHRSGMVAGVGVTDVCADDEATFDYGPGSKPIVRKGTGERGEPIGYFAWIELKSGGYIWEYMTRKEVDAHRRKFSKMPNGKGWRDSFDAMAKKTVLLRVMKLAPKSVEINEALFADNRIVKDPMRLDDQESVVLPDEMMVEAQAETVEVPEGVDPATGELFAGKEGEA